MENANLYKIIPGSPEEGHKLQTFVKSYRSTKGYTYPEVSKKKIVKQIEFLLRDPMYKSLRNIFKALAEVHEVAPVTIGKWYYQFSDEYVSIPRAHKPKRKPKTPNLSTTSEESKLLNLVSELSKLGSNVTININVSI